MGEMLHADKTAAHGTSLVGRDDTASACGRLLDEAAALADAIE